MTRFARSLGSKASNARVPEDATSWSEMRQQLLESKDKTGGGSPTHQRTTVFSAPDKTTVESSGQPSSSGDWAEFETPSAPKEKKKKHKKCKDKTSLKSDDELHSVNDGGKIKKKKKEKKRNASELHAFDDEGVNATEKLSTAISSKSKKLEKNQSKSQGNKIEKYDNQSHANKLQIMKFDKTEQPALVEAVKVKKRRKPIEENRKFIVDGREIEIESFDGFPVKKEDAIRLRELKRKMLSQGIPKAEVRNAMKLERRRSEKALSRERRKVCFHCRGPGHLMSECPALAEGSCTVCFKCGSTEHTSPECHVTSGNDYKFGQCFVCGEQGHIARQCPDNPRGLYPQGGGCRVCGDVTHLKKDCPDLAEERKDNAITLGTSSQATPLEALDEDAPQTPKLQPAKKNKIIKFF